MEESTEPTRHQLEHAKKCADLAKQADVQVVNVVENLSQTVSGGLVGLGLGLLVLKQMNKLNVKLDLNDPKDVVGIIAAAVVGIVLVVLRGRDLHQRNKRVIPDLQRKFRYSFAQTNRELVRACMKENQVMISNKITKTFPELFKESSVEDAS